DCQVKPAPNATKATRVVRSASLTAAGSILQEVQRMEIELGRIDGRDDRLQLRLALVALHLPEIALERQIEPHVVGGEEDPDAPAMRIRRGCPQDQRHLAGAEADQ